jgi:membrane associated rhomboid family serine protease
VGMPGVEQAIAWQAHIGGFLVGLFAFAAFDPVPRSTEFDSGKGPDPTPTIH